MVEKKTPPTPPWMFWTLFLAGAYNLIWGAIAILFPSLSFSFFGMEPPLYLELWQCIGMIVGVYGLGYMIASSNPYRHWPIILVGFLGKVLGPIGFAKALFDGTFPPAFGINIIFNDLIWWIPFSICLWKVYRFHHQDSSQPVPLNPQKLRQWMDSPAHSPSDTEKSTPQLVVAFRHQGCTFTREALHDLAQVKDQILKKGWQLKLLHMGDQEEFGQLAKQYLGPGDWHTVSDPQQDVYSSMGLSRGRLHQVLGWQEFLHGFRGILKGFGIGPLRGDGLQLAGMLLYTDGEVKAHFATEKASTRLPFRQWIDKF